MFHLVLVSLLLFDYSNALPLERDTDGYNDVTIKQGLSFVYLAYGAFTLAYIVAIVN